MANDVVLNAGAGGDTIAADDVLGVKYQRVKLTDGTEDATTVIAADSGVKANALRVTLATDQVQLTNALKVDGSAVTQPVSAASLPLPTGASTAAKQPALGTAGTASADVIS